MFYGCALEYEETDDADPAVEKRVGIHLSLSKHHIYALYDLTSLQCIPKKK